MTTVAEPIPRAPADARPFSLVRNGVVFAAMALAALMVMPLPWTPIPVSLVLFVVLAAPFFVRPLVWPRSLRS